VIAYVKARKRSARQVTISFDEWNVWFHSKDRDRAVLDGAEGWPTAPRLLEDAYTLEDALMVGLILNSFIRKSHIVRIACLAQVVNVIAPIMTEPGGPAWRQTIYYPFHYASLWGRGTALRLSVSGPQHDTAVADKVDYLDIAGVRGEDGSVTLFAVNRHLTETAETTVDLRGFGALRIAAHKVMKHPDPGAVNTLDAPLTVVPGDGDSAGLDGGPLGFAMPPLSWAAIRLVPVA
jgi:alpha-L-arabinofuranosidase